MKYCCADTGSETAALVVLTPDMRQGAFRGDEWA
jgi:hypothetical protein